MTRLKPAALSLLVAFALTACPGDSPAEDAGEPEGEPTFTRVRDEVIVLNCSTAQCHGGSDPQRGLRMDSDDVYSNLVDADAEEIDEFTQLPWKIVVPGDPEASLMYRALVTDIDGVWQGSELDRPLDDMQKMPPDIAQLAQSKMDLIYDWIEAGALDD